MPRKGLSGGEIDLLREALTIHGDALSDRWASVVDLSANWELSRSLSFPAEVIRRRLSRRAWLCDTGLESHQAKVGGCRHFQVSPLARGRFESGWWKPFCSTVCTFMAVDNDVDSFLESAGFSSGVVFGGPAVATRTHLVRAESLGVVHVCVLDALLLDLDYVVFEDREGYGLVEKTQ